MSEEQNPAEASKEVVSIATNEQTETTKEQTISQPITENVSLEQKTETTLESKTENVVQESKTENATLESKTEVVLGLDADVNNYIFVHGTKFNVRLARKSKFLDACKITGRKENNNYYVDEQQNSPSKITEEELKAAKFISDFMNKYVDTELPNLPDHVLNFKTMRELLENNYKEEFQVFEHDSKTNDSKTNDAFLNSYSLSPGDMRLAVQIMAHFYEFEYLRNVAELYIAMDIKHNNEEWNVNFYKGENMPADECYAALKNPSIMAFHQDWINACEKNA